MNPTITVLAFARAVCFEGVSLGQRYLQENGVSSIGTYKLKRYVLLPAVIWCLIFVRSSDLSFIAQHQRLLTFMILLPIIHEAQELLFSYIINVTSSVSACKVLTNIFSLPLLLLIGTFFNHDIPNGFIIVAILLLVLAHIIQPSKHRLNLRGRFSRPVAVVVTLVFLQTLLEAVGFGLTREALKQLHPSTYLGVYLVSTTLLLIGWTLFLPRNTRDGVILKKKLWQTIANPTLWFVGEIAQVFAQAVLPIYTLVSIGSVTFGMDVTSDLVQRRIRVSLRSFVFMFLFLVGLALAVYSTR